MSVDTDAVLAATFAAQHSLISRAQVLRSGVSPHAIEHRLRRGRWEIADRGVYALAGVPWTWHRHLCALALACPIGFASHRAAAKLLGVGGFERPPLELTVPNGRQLRRTVDARAAAAGLEVIVHQVRDVSLEPTTVLDGIRTCSPLRLAVDIGSVVSFDRYYRIIGDLRRSHGLTWSDLDRLWRRHSRRGRDGCGPLHELLDRHFATEGAPTEVIEARCAGLLVDAGLPEPVHQFEVVRPDGRRAVLDLAYPELRIGIETEGRIHDWSDVRQRDHTRRNNMQLLGWILFHFTWEDVAHRPTYVVDVVREAVTQRHHQVLCGDSPGHDG